MTTRDKLLADIERYLERTGLTAREFGVRVRNDTALVYRMRKGGTITMEAADRVRAYMAAHPPTSKKRAAEPRPAA